MKINLFVKSWKNYISCKIFPLEIDITSKGTVLPTWKSIGQRQVQTMYHLTIRRQTGRGNCLLPISFERNQFQFMAQPTNNEFSNTNMILQPTMRSYLARKILVPCNDYIKLFWTAKQPFLQQSGVAFFSYTSSPPRRPHSARTRHDDYSHSGP